MTVLKERLYASTAPNRFESGPSRDPENDLIYRIRRSELIEQLRSPEFEAVSPECKKIATSIADVMLQHVAASSGLSFAIYADEDEVEIIAQNKISGRRLAYMFNTPKTVVTYFAGANGPLPRTSATGLLSVPRDLTWVS